MEKNLIFPCLDSEEEIGFLSHKWKNLIWAVTENPAGE